MTDHKGGDLPRLLTIKEVAESLNVSTRSIRRWIDLEEIPVVRLGRILRVSANDVQVFLNRHRWGSNNPSCKNINMH